MLEWADDLKIGACDLYLDSRQPRAQSFVSHAHSDHIGQHEKTIATPATAALLEHRLGVANLSPVNFFEKLRINPDFTARLLPAGHVLGSAMLHLTGPAGTLLYTGDFKLRDSLTVEKSQPEPADALLMESTYGLPHFRFPPWRETADRLSELVAEAFREGRQPIVMGYSLGKAQEITRILTDAGFAVTLHGAVHSISKIYERFGVGQGNYRRYAYADFHGHNALDLRERGVLVAPPQVTRSGFVTRFPNPMRIMMSGWSLLKNAIYRYGVDHALPLSDHADFEELMELIERVHPKKIYTHHGFPEFVDTLRARGLDAQLARPPAQLSLFE